MILITVNHPVPLFDDSYAVNSATLGPYGDAIVYELIPEIERRYRGLGEGWARGVFGGSTGGWESLATQVFYPDEFNWAGAACPDPITFTSYATVDIYDSENAYFYDSLLKKTARPGYRDGYSGQSLDYVNPYGQVIATIEEMNLRELALGAHSRSCGQWDIWEAVFSPSCPNGFPCRMYDKKTGTINATIANFWKENYDLIHIIQRDWDTLGPKLQGKLNIFVGGSDSFYLVNAVMDAQKALEDIGSDAKVVIGAHDGKGFQHCFRGYEYNLTTGEPLPNSITRLLYTNFLVEMAPHFASTAPAGADVNSWRY